MGAYRRTAGRMIPHRFVFTVFAIILLAAAPLRPAKAQFCDPCTSAAITAQTLVFTPLLATDAAMLTQMATDPLWGLPAIFDALYGIPGPAFAAGFPGIDLDMVTGFQQVNGSLNMIASQVLPRHAQMGADATKAYNDAQGQADESVRAVVAPQSTHCAMTQGNQLRAAMNGFVNSFTRAAMHLISNRDTGAGAGQASVAQLACEQAPFIANDPRLLPATAAAIANCAQSDAVGAAAVPAYLVDGNMDIDNVFGKLQLELPDNIQLTPNNHIRFQPQDDTQWEFVAAWRYCESHVPKAPMSPTGAPPASGLTETDYKKMLALDDAGESSIPAIRDCVHAIAYRTACPQTSQGDFAGAGAGSGNCWQIQNLACYRLKDQPPSGLGITTTGDSDADYALANCDDDGLSPAMYDYILAHRCSDTNYTMGAVAQDTADATQVNDEQAACGEAVANFKKGLEQEQQNFLDALRGVKKVAAGASK